MNSFKIITDTVSDVVLHVPLLTSPVDLVVDGNPDPIAGIYLELNGKFSLADYLTGEVVYGERYPHLKRLGSALAPKGAKITWCNHRLSTITYSGESAVQMAERLGEQRPWGKQFTSLTHCTECRVVVRVQYQPYPDQFTLDANYALVGEHRFAGLPISFDEQGAYVDLFERITYLPELDHLRPKA